MRILVLDDDDDRHAIFAQRLAGYDVTHAHTAEQAISLLSSQKFNVVYLDHDLNDYPDKYQSVDGKRVLTGYDVAYFIAQCLAVQKRPDKVIVHSWDEVGAKRMVKVLSDVGIPTTYEEFKE